MKSSFYKPTQTVLITSRFYGKDNVMAADWHMPVSFEPPLYAVAIGKTRYTKDLIHKSKVFAVNFIPFKMSDEVLNAGSVSGKFKDKFKEFKIRKDNCSSIDCCYVSDASAFIECEVIQEIDSGDHVIFVGQIIKEKELNDEKRLFHKADGSFTTTIH
jgi:flavin reductase (DIM6/NTAB) family NADH-FMN oxidoreductase RutF